MHHLGIGAAHRGKRILALIDDTTVTVVHLDTGEILATTTSTPTAATGATNNKSPADGRALIHDDTYVATQMTTYVATHHTSAPGGTRTPQKKSLVRGKKRLCPWRDSNPQPFP